jgi:hypothetical protein
MAYLTTDVGKGGRHVALAAIIAAICLAAPVSAQMVIRLSVYSQTTLSVDGTTVYGVTDSSDNSILNGTPCSHSDYQTQTLLITPQGSQYQSPWAAGFAATMDVPFDDDSGYYTEVGTMSFSCSCAGLIEAGNESQACLAHARRPAAPFTPGHERQAGTSKTYELSSVVRVSLRAPGRGARTEKR